jgi:hypothetical protein
MTGKIMPPCERVTSTIQAMADALLSWPRYVNRNTAVTMPASRFRRTRPLSSRHRADTSRNTNHANLSAPMVVTKSGRFKAVP